MRRWMHPTTETICTMTKHALFHLSLKDILKESLNKMVLQRWTWLLLLLQSKSLVGAFLSNPATTVSSTSSATKLGIFGGGGGKIPSSPSDRYVVWRRIFIQTKSRRLFPLLIPSFVYLTFLLFDFVLFSDNQAISAIKAGIAKPKTRGYPLIECEFPPLKELNKLGDGTMRSANEVDQVCPS